MAMPHAASGEAIAVQGAAPAPDLTQFSSIALVRSAELEVIRMTLPKGKALPEHHVPGEITMLCLQGELSIEAHGGSRRLAAGQLMYLNGGQAHALRAEQDSLMLLTIVLVSPRPAA